MAAVDPYAPCPCGSGQKFKWCCQKVEPFAERAQRLFESGQFEAALAAIDEGLRKDAGNPWLLTRKALYQLRQQQPGAAKETLRQVLAKQPQHLGAAMLLTRLELETEGPEAGAAEFQRVLGAVAPEKRRSIAPLARVVGTFLAESGAALAAIQHLKLAQRLGPESAHAIDAALEGLERSPGVSPFQKYDYPLAPAPNGLGADARERFEQALRWADEGRWAAAAAAFEALSSDPATAPAADRNAGLCRLWIDDDTGAVEALGRATQRMGESEEAVDLEALRQQITPSRPDDLVEEVQLIWPLRDRRGLIEALKADAAVYEEGVAPLDATDPKSPEADLFGLLDRPVVAARPDLRAEEVPRYVGHVYVGQEIAVLETYDDGRLDPLVERFRALAGATVAPAHPRTKVLSKLPRSTVALSWEWLLPEGLDRDTVGRLNGEQGAYLVREVWPRTPLPGLGGRTPLQAAEAGHAAVPLRAAVRLMELSNESWRQQVDFRELRERLRIAPEPAIDPDTADIAGLHPSRLELVPIERLNDDRLATLYQKAQSLGLLDVVDRAGRVLVERPQTWQRPETPSLMVFSDLAVIAAERGRAEEALDWVRRGRQADPTDQRAAHAAHWDLLELRLKARTLPPEEWVPELAVVLSRYENQNDAAPILMSTLLDLGLIDVQPNPDNPGDLLIDSRALQAVIARYGPRVTTTSGELGIAATRGGLWTPGAGAPAGGGAVWTPGSGAPASAPAQEGPSKLIIPGR